MTMVIGVTHHFIDGCGTEALAGIAVLFCTASRAHVRVKHVQVRRLIFIMRDTGVVDFGNFVEGERAVKSKVFLSLGRIVSALTVRGQFLHNFVPVLLMITIKILPYTPA